jgi:hypothetical protein
MITITLNDNTKKCFNLNNNEREEALYNAWFSMNDDIKYANKRLKITTHKNEVLNLKISEIKNCKHEDCIYCDNPEVGHIKNRQKKKEEPKPEPSIMDRLNAAQKHKEEVRIELFLTELRNRNVAINLNDPTLLQILENVKKSNEKWRIQLYANMYESLKRQ